MLVVDNYGFRKAIYIKGYTHEELDLLTSLELRIRRSDGTLLIKNLAQSDRDANKNFTWLLEQGDLTVSGIYKIQAVGISGTRRVAVCKIDVHVCELI
jgi:hypothetical protein